MTKIHFLGASGTVTGSKYLIDTGKIQILVDCGLFQGLKQLRNLNWNEMPIAEKEIDMVLLTHGHLDHTGYLPRLVKHGFSGPIVGTSPTLGITEIILKDSARIQEEEAENANRGGYSRHHPAKPLYTLKDAYEAIALFKSAPLQEWIEIFEGIRVRFRPNGHILGATFIEMDVEGKIFVFSGDIGRTEDYLLEPPQRPEKADILFIESTYGDRLHKPENVEFKLRDIVNETVKDGGTLIIPSFAVERAQALMYLLWKLKQAKAIPQVPMILDSPMGSGVLELFWKYHDWQKLTKEETAAMIDQFRVVENYQETKEVMQDRRPKIVIAGSGMMTGGRVLSYLTEYIERPETGLILVGYQAEGTRGRKILEGEKQTKIYGKYYDVKAKVYTINSLSAHGDQQELLDWMSELKNAPEHLFIVHGESRPAEMLRTKIQQRYNWQGEVPVLYSIKDV